MGVLRMPAREVSTTNATTANSNATTATICCRTVIHRLLSETKSKRRHVLHDYLPTRNVCKPNADSMHALPCWKVREPDGADGIQCLFGLRCRNYCFGKRNVAMFALLKRILLPKCHVNFALPYCFGKRNVGMFASVRRNFYAEHGLYNARRSCRFRRLDGDGERHGVLYADGSERQEAF